MYIYCFHCFCLLFFRTLHCLNKKKRKKVANRTEIQRHRETQRQTSTEQHKAQFSLFPSRVHTQSHVHTVNGCANECDCMFRSWFGEIITHTSATNVACNGPCHGYRLPICSKPARTTQSTSNTDHAWWLQSHIQDSRKAHMCMQMHTERVMSNNLAGGATYETWRWNKATAKCSDTCTAFAAQGQLENITKYAIGAYGFSKPC